MNVGQKGFVKMYDMKIRVETLNVKLMIFTGISSIVIVRRFVAAGIPDFKYKK
jgi:hypothetical protein